VYFSTKSCFVLFFQLTSDKMSLTWSGLLMSHRFANRCSRSILFLTVSFAYPFFFNSSAYVNIALMSNLVGAENLTFLESTPASSALSPA